MRYSAFISYRHDGLDAEIAGRLQRLIENWSIPGKIAKELGQKKFDRVFRDEDELQASSDLSAAIEEALDESEWLFVVCTKRYNESKWCLGEIEYFLKKRDREHIIVILADGEPDESFPEALTHIEKNGEIVEIEPLAVDIRAESEKDVIKNLKKEKIRFFSSMLSVNYDDLKNRQKVRRLRITLGSSAAAFAILIGVLAVILAKNIELNKAYTALDNSMQETLKGESFYLSEYADAAYADGDRKTAIKLALQALPKDFSNPERPYVARAMKSLTSALGVYDHSDGYRVYESIDLDGETFDVKTEASSDGEKLMVERYSYAAGNTLNREVSIYSLNDGRSIFTEELTPINKSYYHSASGGARFSKDGKSLIYASKDGVKVKDIESGKDAMTGKVAAELRLSPAGDVIVAVDYDGGYLRTYGLDGEELIDCEIGKDMNYLLGQISPDGKMVSLSARTEEMSGVITIDLNSGQNAFIQTPGECSDVRFIDKNRLVFLQADAEDGLKHIVYYDLTNADEGYLCNTDWDVQSMAISDVETCYYYHDNKVYEVDCKSNKKGKKKWENVFSSNVVSVQTGDGLVGVTCQDGSVNIFNEADKEQIRTPGGDKNPNYLMSLDKEYVSMRDYWGRHIRIYKKSGESEYEAKKLDLSDTISYAPKKWYHAYGENGEGFVMGFHAGNRDDLAVFDGDAFKKISSSNLADMDYEGFDNLTLDLKNREYLLIQDFGFYTNTHFSNKELKNTLQFDEDTYYYYDETGETLYLAKDGKIAVYDAANGTKKEEITLASGYDRGVKIGDDLVLGNDDSINIDFKDEKKQDVKLDDAVLYSFNSARGSVFYRNKAKDKWFVYEINTGKTLCEGQAGAYSCVMFFGNNRYLLNDYNSVYDMNTWEKVLDLKSLEGSIYGVQTTDDLDFFIVWAKNSESDESGKSGADLAYLYDKKSREVVGEILDFVTMTPDGQVVSYDGKIGLYKFPLYSASKLVEMAREKVGDEGFTDAQREEYHLYN
ncbi:MAG: TIR domain-containing protein [Eubacterium sp.]|nr:TIR domain-containing protein [Eubacterium sp.]